MELHDFLFELGTEELPSGAVSTLSLSLARNIEEAFAKANITYGKVRYFATPRRLAVLIHDVATQQKTIAISRRGPAVSLSLDTDGKPLPALIGFAKSCGADLQDLTKVKTDKGEWWAYEATQSGAKTYDLLISMVNDSLAKLPIAKPMRWGDGDETFSRPVHWAVLLFGDKVVDGKILGLTTSNISYGHRFHHPKAISISAPCLYESSLEDGMVIADFNRRRQVISEQIEKISSDRNLDAVVPDELLEEVTSIVEWPNSMLVGFDPIFLDVPSEALIASMQSHQKCFALRDKSNRLSPYFITVSNIQSINPKQVVLGNEMVMRARLSDAEFFYNQDKKRPLSYYLPATKNVIFQIKLGSLADKVSRMSHLMTYLALLLNLNNDEALRAVLLSKCDLLTGMVKEFPELQGVMGEYYALNDGESPAVALSLKEQYLPKFSKDELPTSSLGMALSLVDRLDTLVGLFAIGQKPTGVKDPFKLRRHALAVVRILIALPIRVNISVLLEKAYLAFSDEITKSHDWLPELHVFIMERMQSFYQSQGISNEIINAVRAKQNDWLFDVDKRISALFEFINCKEAASLSAICKRVRNLLLQVKEDSYIAVQTDLLIEPAERVLYDQIETIEKSVEPFYKAGNYTNVLGQLVVLREPLDNFFENVMVMVDDEAIKKNRLSLLTRLQNLLQGVADIALLNMS